MPGDPARVPDQPSRGRLDATPLGGVDSEVATMTEDATLVLAFDLAALRRLADPAGAVADATDWSRAVGVVSEKPAHVVSKFTRDRGIVQDFEPGPEPPGEALAHVREHYDAGRYAYVGVGPSHRETARSADWEFVPVEEAAASAGWTVVADETADEPTRTETATDDWP